MQRVRERLKLVLPVTLFLVLMLLYLNTRSLAKTAIILLAVPFSAVGAVWLLYLLGYNMSIGVWVGLIALLGVDAETGVFMLLYLDLAYEDARREGRLRSLGDLRDADHARRREADSPEVHDRGGDVHGARADHVVRWRRRRRDEADRRTDDRRHLHVVRPRAGRLPGHLRDLEMAFRPETGTPGSVIMRVIPVVLAAVSLSLASIDAQQKQTYIGIVTDTMCNRDHKAMNHTGPEDKCVRDCAGDGKTYSTHLGDRRGRGPVQRPGDTGEVRGKESESNRRALSEDEHFEGGVNRFVEVSEIGGDCCHDQIEGREKRDPGEHDWDCRPHRDQRNQRAAIVGTNDDAVARLRSASARCRHATGARRATGAD